MMIYLDNSATTKPYTEVIEVYTKALQEYYGNPSSLHQLGANAAKVLQAAREVSANLLQVSPEEIIFTTGGTEGNNLAILGVAFQYSRRGKHLITSQIEHSSVLHTFRYLEQQGFEVTYLPVDHQGHISITDVEKALRSDTTLVSIMHVNSEIGTIQPIAEIGKLLSKRPKTIFHVDAVQSYAKIPVSPKSWGIDLLTVSGHKLHGPKGTGLLYKAEKIRLQPLQYGGGQENGLRSGTENVPGIIAFTKAMRMSSERQRQFETEVGSLRKRLWQGLEAIPDVTINSPQIGVPHILNFSVPGIKPEVMLHALEEKGIYVSTKSACSSKEESISHVLQAIDLPIDRSKSALRISLSSFNTVTEIDYTLEKIKEMIIELKEIAKV